MADPRATRRKSDAQRAQFLTDKRKKRKKAGPGMLPNTAVRKRATRKRTVR
jgi:hypothetical protein